MNKELLKENVTESNLVNGPLSYFVVDTVFGAFVRKEPNEESDVVLTLRHGHKLFVVENVGDFSSISLEYNGDIIGYVKNALIKEVFNGRE